MTGDRNIILISASWKYIQFLIFEMFDKSYFDSQREEAE